MFWLILIPAIWLIAALYDYIVADYGYKRNFFDSIKESSVFIMVGVFIAVIGLIVCNSQINEERVTYANLMTIQDNSTTQGRFSLFGGSVNEVPSYSYYLDSGNGRYRLHSVPASDSYITYTDDQPRIYFHGWKSDWGFWTIPWEGDRNVGNRYEFAVPQGSIQQNYVLDAK